MKTKIKYLRQEMGITQKDFAEKVGVSRQTINALENGKDGDVILLAGKGHETYIIDKDGTHYFSEKDIVMNFTERKEF